MRPPHFLALPLIGGLNRLSRIPALRENPGCQTPTPWLQAIPREKTAIWNHQRYPSTLPAVHSKGNHNAASHTMVATSRQSGEGERGRVGVERPEGGRERAGTERSDGGDSWRRRGVGREEINDRKQSGVLHKHLGDKRGRPHKIADEEQERRSCECPGKRREPETGDLFTQS